MRLPPTRQFGTLLRRYKRFLADIQLKNGHTITVHCPNTGSMRGCSQPDSPVVISKSDNPKRKYAWTLEMIQHNKIWIGVNTNLTNKIVHEALTNGIISDFGKILSVRAEVKISAKSRLDFYLETKNKKIYLEVKNCSMAKNKIALFPDAVTARGTKHLEDLDRLRRKGYDAAVLFCVQRADTECFAPAAEIDPLYAKTLKEVSANGVQVLAYQAEVQPDEIKLSHPLPILTSACPGNIA